MTNAEKITNELLSVQPMDSSMFPVIKSASTIKMLWKENPPFYYGEYAGELIDGSLCTIDVDWKIKVYKLEGDVLMKRGDQVGTDKILYWYCTEDHVKSLLNGLENK